jgi:8-oxo-dGTP pyrophosphatase MutT (NUDIX family)
VTKTWRIAGSRTILKDRWIDLRADRCLTPAGTEIAPYYVLSYPDWVHVVAVTADDRMVLVRQYRHAVGEAVLELPGGVIDASDRDPEAAARRELAEETGYGAGAWRMVGSFYPNPATHTNRVHVVLALDARPGVGPSLDPGEEGLETLTLPVREVLAGLPGGLIGQAMHVAAVYLGLSAAGRLGLAGSAATPTG